MTAKSMSLDLNGITPPRKKAKGAETTGTNESEQREKMKPKNSCCQFYPIRLCGKRRTEERPKRGKAIFLEQKENKGGRETRGRQGIETPERRGRTTDIVGPDRSDQKKEKAGRAVLKSLVK